MEHYLSGKHAVVVIAQPGVGKTGVALELAFRMGTHPDDTQLVDIQNIHTQCGMNDLEWKEQYERNMLPSLGINISHRGAIKKTEHALRNIERGLIIPDECHIASGKGMNTIESTKGCWITEH